MDVTTRYPEAVPLRSINAKFVIKALLNFFTHFGLPAEVQSDQGTNFTSKLFKKTMTKCFVNFSYLLIVRPDISSRVSRNFWHI